MRGDSLRDLYAKSLALLGLAFLGALGAAVDYWPANLSIPRTSEFDFQIATLRPLPNVTMPDIAVVPTRHVAARHTVTATPVESITAPVVETSADNVSAVTQDTQVKPEALEFAAPGSFTGFSNQHSQIALSAPEDTFIVTTVARNSPPPPPVMDRGLIVGFMSSVSDGGSKAGEMLMNSLQAVGRVGGAMKTGASKLWPFSRSNDRNRQIIRPILGPSPDAS